LALYFAFLVDYGPFLRLLVECAQIVENVSSEAAKEPNISIDRYCAGPLPRIRHAAQRLGALPEAVDERLGVDADLYVEQELE